MKPASNLTARISRRSSCRLSRGNDPEQRAALRGTQQELRLTGTRYDAWVSAERNAAILWGWLMRGAGRKLAPVICLVLNKDKPQSTVVRSRKVGDVATEVHSVRTAVRRGPRGASVSDLVVEITQRRHGYFDTAEQKLKDRGNPLARDARHDFTYRAGCTLLIDPVTMEVRRVIRTLGTINDNERLEELRKFLTERSEPVNAFARTQDTLRNHEPFALLHRNEEG